MQKESSQLSDKELLRELVAIKERTSAFSVNKLDIMLRHEAIKLIYLLTGK